MLRIKYVTNNSNFGSDVPLSVTQPIDTSHFLKPSYYQTGQISNNNMAKTGLPNKPINNVSLNPSKNSFNE